jgi:hypothetical protein
MLSLGWSEIARMAAVVELDVWTPRTPEQILVVKALPAYTRLGEMQRPLRETTT